MRVRPRVSIVQPAAVEQQVPQEVAEALRGGPHVQLVDRRAAAPLVKSLSGIQAWRSWCGIAFNWGVMLGAIALTIWVDHWALYFPAILLIGARQHAMAILTHDASHYRLFKSRWWNDTVCDLFCCLPAGISLRAFRELHLQHHWYLNTQKDPDFTAHQGDPDFVFPMPRKRFLGIIFRDLTLLHIRQAWKGRRGYSPFGAGRGWRSWLLGRKATDPQALTGQERARVLVVIAAGITLAVALPWWIVWRAAILWFVPWFTMLTLCLRMRSAGEHLNVPNNHELDAGRTMVTSFWTRTSFWPHGIGYHMAHHIFPSVPYYNLKKLHAGLMQMPAYAENLHVTRGFSGLLDELAPRDQDAPSGRPQAA